ncbi:response regulator [Alkalicaulis satelles]|uniref:histidine kinase n=1 Tax=Alkalicaulis satelles TaxID=2609175 RepID=A0A5M6ZHT9_9PROT|nr:ATP-binding protein [Alkalicaulis satelles]KAA5803655.1 response regulator [Alkalicaulis satelles]
MSAPSDSAPSNRPGPAQLLEAMSEILAASGPDGTLAYVNPAFLAVFGGAAGDWLGRDLDIALQGLDSKRLFEWTRAPLPGGGVVALGRDVSAAREAARGKSVFFASVTHELRTPLAGALGAADLLRETGLKPDQMAYLDVVRASAEHALRLIDDILDLSRLEAGALALRPEPVDLRGLIEDACEMLALRAAQKGLTLDHVICPDVPELIRADPGRVRQILFNLAGNAVKFTDSGGVLVEAEYRKGAIRLSVRDTGPGISEDDQTRLFEHFERGAQEGSGAPGAGLGLAMVRRLAEAAGGQAGISSSPGAGALFWCQWPAEALAPAPRARPLAGRTVLVAAPEAFQRQALAAQASCLGAHALAAEDIETAWALAADQTGPLTLILSEAWADEAGGLKTAAPRARLLALARPETKDLFSAAARPAGFDGWLVAPVRLRSLAAFAAGQDADAAPPSTAAKAPVRGRPLAGLSVLLAEDDPVNTLIARTVLERLGARVTHAADGRAAVEAAAGGEHDAAILDLRMPVMDGLAAARAIRALPGAASAMPLAALTANATEADRTLCLAAGMDAFLTKPLDPDVLADVLTGLCAPQNRARLA